MGRHHTRDLNEHLAMRFFLDTMWTHDIFNQSQAHRALIISYQVRYEVPEDGRQNQRQMISMEKSNPNMIARIGKCTGSIPLRKDRYCALSETTFVDLSKDCALWKGILYKRSTKIFRSWVSQLFKLTAQHTASKFPVLSYISKTKGERHLIIHDARREHRLDCDQLIGLSIGFTDSPVCNVAYAHSKAQTKRMMLMATSDLEAVALLTCLRHVLEPGRTLPTLWMAMHFPAQALRMLE
jgi:hypothetical protein